MAIIIPKKLKNRICIVVYDDATYATRNIDPKIPPAKNVSVGKIRRITTDFVDLAFVLKGTHPSKGVVIPSVAIESCEALICTS